MTRRELCNLWPKLSGPLALLQKWECPRGIIFESDPASRLDAVTAAAAILEGHLEKFERHPVLKDDWRKRAGRYLTGEISPNALYEPSRDRIVLVVMDLDRQPEWLQLSMKRPMDCSDPPRRTICLLATANDATQVPDNIRSHFFVVRKTGRRRGFNR